MNYFRHAFWALTSVILMHSGCSKRSAPQAPTEPFVRTSTVEIDRRGIDTNALLGESAKTVEGDGGTPLLVVGAEAVAEGDRVGGFVEIGAEMCLVAYARGTEGIEDLDVLVFDDEGASLAADQSIGLRPAVILCPPHPDRVYVTARASSGSGLMALGVHALPPRHAPSVAIKLGARMATDEMDTPQEAWPGLAKRVEQRRRELAGRWVEVRRIALPLNPRSASHVSVPLPSARCVDVLVVPSEDVRGLNVTLADDTGATIVRAVERGNDHVALVCTPVDTTITVAIRPRRGHGYAAVVFSRSEPGVEKELAILPDARRVGPMEPLETVAKRVSTTLTDAKYQPAREIARGELAMGKTVLHRHSLGVGCTRFDVMAGAPILGLRTALWAGDVLWGRSEGGEQTTLFGCTERVRDVELEVECQGRPGRYLVEARPEVRAPAILGAHPVAASRLLARLNAEGEAVPASDLMNTQTLAVDDHRRGVYVWTIPAKSCRTVVGALGPGASGLEMQVVDGSNNTVIVKGTGHHVVSLRPCAGILPLRTEVRLSVRAGKTAALVGHLAR